MTEISRGGPYVLVRALTVGGKRADIDLTTKVKSFVYEDNERKADKLEITIENWHLDDLDDPTWQHGTILEVTWGYPHEMALTRTVQIRSVKGFAELTIEAYGLEVNFGKVVKNRVFENMTRADVVEKIAKEAGFNSPTSLLIESYDDATVYPQIVQSRQTDAAFIRRLARKEGFIWFVDFDGFHFHQRDLTQRPSRVFTWYNVGSSEGDIISLDIENDITGKPGKVKVKGRDSKERKPIDEDADKDTEEKEPVAAETIYTLNPETVALLEIETLQDQKKVDSKTVAQTSIEASSEGTAEGAKRQAKGKFRESRQVTVKLKMTVVGSARILAKSVFELRGAGKRLSQIYYIRKCTHTIQDGYTCDIEAISDGTGRYEKASKRAKGIDIIQVGAATKGKRGPKPGEDGDKDNPAATITAKKGEFLDPEQVVNRAIQDRGAYPHLQAGSAELRYNINAARRAAEGRSTLQDAMGTVDPFILRAALRFREEKLGEIATFVALERNILEESDQATAADVIDAISTSIPDPGGLGELTLGET